jgi:hypothetical protein
VAGVVAAAAARPLRGLWAGIAGFALGWSVGFHPTLIVLAVPVALGLLLERAERKTAGATAVGLLAGLFPFWALTRWVCQPYGDWTRWSVLKQLAFSVPELRAVALALLARAVLAGGGRWADSVRVGRAADSRLDDGLRGAGGCCGRAPAFGGGGPGASARRCAARAATWSGIRCLRPAAAGGRRRDRACRAADSGALLAGGADRRRAVFGSSSVETRWDSEPAARLAGDPAGIALWRRRAAGARGAAPARRGRFQSGLLVALLAAAGQRTHRGRRVFMVGERGAKAWTADVAERLGTIAGSFRNYPPSVRTRRACGNARWAWAKPPSRIGGRRPWWPRRSGPPRLVATSHAPCALEDGVGWNRRLPQAEPFPS